MARHRVFAIANAGTRTAVAFVDGGRFAYSDWVGQRAEVRVLRIAGGD